MGRPSIRATIRAEQPPAADALQPPLRYGFRARLRRSVRLHQENKKRGFPMSNSRPQAYQRLAELLIGSRISMALRVVAEHQIADHLATGPQTAEALSSTTGIPASTLRRLMRGLADIGVFAETSEGRFANTDVSEYMRSDVTPSLREMILFLNDDAVLQGWQHLPTALQSGAPSFPAANGVAFFDYIAADPQRSATVGKAMAGIYGPEGPKIAVSYPFGRFATLIDIGGGPRPYRRRDVEAVSRAARGTVGSAAHGRRGAPFLGRAGPVAPLRCIRGRFFCRGASGL